MSPAHRFRPARPEDAAACIDIRGRTRENAFDAEQLRDLGITPESWAEGIRAGAFPGYVHEQGGAIRGYCFGDAETGEVLVLALLPEYEGRGLGKTLLSLVTEDFRQRGFQRLFLACAADPAVRSHGFYRHLGWVATGERDDAGDDILEFRL